MRYAAITAAVFGGAMFMTTGSQASLADAGHFNSIINKSQAQTVQIASAARPSAVTSKAARTTAPPEPEKPVVVAVELGDSLTKLAADHGTSYQRLFDANPGVENPNLIIPGQELRVPTADEVLASRPLPVEVVAVQAATTLSTAPAVRQVATPLSAPAIASGSVWDGLAACESGGNWAINTGNGFYGGLQFTLASWQAVGGTGMPNQASREEQILRGQILQARGGWGNWPACTAKLGIG